MAAMEAVVDAVGPRLHKRVQPVGTAREPVGLALLKPHPNPCEHAARTMVHGHVIVRTLRATVPHQPAIASQTGARVPLTVLSFH